MVPLTADGPTYSRWSHLRTIPLPADHTLQPARLAAQVRADTQLADMTLWRAVRIGIEAAMQVCFKARRSAGGPAARRRRTGCPHFCFFAARRVLDAASCLLHCPSNVARCWLHLVCCMLHGVCCMVHVVCCKPHAACCVRSHFCNSQHRRAAVDDQAHRPAPHAEPRRGARQGRAHLSLRPVRPSAAYLRRRSESEIRARIIGISVPENRNNGTDNRKQRY